VKPAALHLHIETLVLDGFPAADGRAIRAAIESELTRLFAAGGVPDGLGQARSIGRLDGGSFSLPQESGVQGSAPRIGGEVAAAIYRGVSR